MSQKMEQAKFDLKGWGAIAECLEVSVGTVRKWARNCNLPIYQVEAGGLVMASKSELEVWKKSHRYDIRNLKKPEVKTT